MQDYLTLSGGEKQRVNFARVASQIWPDNSSETKYLLLDEPLSSLDIRYQLELMQQMKILMKKQKMVIIGIVHDINLATNFADFILLLHNAKEVAQGASKEVLSEKNISFAYGLQPLINHIGEDIYITFRLK